ncbi:MAG: hypothetical protein ACQERS_08690 [Bacteroidota bacterium]
MEKEVKGKKTNSLPDPKLIFRYVLFIYILAMTLYGIVTGLDYPVWMLLVLVFLAGINLGTLIKGKKNNDLTLLN